MKKIIDTIAHPITFFRRNMKSVLCLAGGTVLLIFAITLFYHTPDRRFERLLTEYMAEELSADGLTLHYMLADPETYSVRNPSHTFQTYYTGSAEESRTAAEELLVLLDKTDPHTLSPANRMTYETFRDYLTSEIKGYKYFYYEEPLTFSSGMHVQLPILLSEYTFRNTADVEHYLTLLASLPDYLNGVLLFEQEKAAQGLFMSEYALKQVLTQCSEVITEESLTAGNHLLQTTFQERLETLLSSGQLSETDYETYLTQNTNILNKSVLPAYTALTNGLLALRDSAGDSRGLIYGEQGEDYYKYLVKQQTGSDKSIEELIDTLQSAFLADYESLELLLPALGNAESGFTLEKLYSDAGVQNASKESSLCDGADIIMDDLMRKTAILFPEPAESDTLRILPVEPLLENYVSPAFYLTPPLDAYHSNVIYINGADKPDDLTLYTTLAHEGYPGHLFQTTCFYRAIKEGTIHPARALLNYPGYTEGYATYAEFLSYEYAESYGDSDYIQAMCLNRRLHLALYSLLDICIHYYGYTNEDVYECLAIFGIEDRKTAGEIYEYIVNSPATYLSYYIGYLEITECRELSELCWKDSYSLQNFHCFLLTNGPAPFALIKEQIRAVDPHLITDKGY